MAEVPKWILNPATGKYVLSAEHPALAKQWLAKNTAPATSPPPTTPPTTADPSFAGPPTPNQLVNMQSIASSVVSQGGTYEDVVAALKQAYPNVGSVYINSAALPYASSAGQGTTGAGTEVLPELAGPNVTGLTADQQAIIDQVTRTIQQALATGNPQRTAISAADIGTQLTQAGVGAAKVATLTAYFQKLNDQLQAIPAPPAGYWGGGYAWNGTEWVQQAGALPAPYTRYNGVDPADLPADIRARFFWQNPADQQWYPSYAAPGSQTQWGDVTLSPPGGTTVGPDGTTIPWWSGAGGNTTTTPPEGYTGGPVTGGGGDSGSGGTGGTGTGGGTVDPNVKAQFQQFLTDNGLPSSLMGFITDALIQGKPQAQIIAELRQTPEYLAAYPENALRQQNGFAWMPEAQIRAFRDEAKRISKDSLGFDATNGEIAGLIANNVSLPEWEQRLQTWKNFERFGPTVRAVLESELGVNIPDDRVFAFMSPDISTPELDQAYQDALYRGQPAILGLGVRPADEAAMLQRYGIDVQQSFRGYQAIAGDLPRAERMKAIEDHITQNATLPDTGSALFNDTSFATLFRAIQLQDPAAIRILQDQMDREIARFREGGGAVTQGTQAVGLETAAQRAQG